MLALKAHQTSITPVDLGQGSTTAFACVCVCVRRGRESEREGGRGKVRERERERERKLGGGGGGGGGGYPQHPSQPRPGRVSPQSQRRAACVIQRERARARESARESERQNHASLPGLAALPAYCAHQMPPRLYICPTRCSARWVMCKS